MILTCPSCSTRYFADDASIGAKGRSVRCGSCSHTWFVEGRLDLDTAAAAGTPATRESVTRDQVERMRRASAPVAGSGSVNARLRAQQLEREKRERANAAMLAWGATGVAAISLGAGGVVFREDVVKVWPKTAGVYAAMGLGVNLYGLEIDDLTVDQEFEGGETVFVVRGAVTNIGRDDKPAPLLRLGLRDAAAAEIHHQIADLQGQTIPAGGRLTFSFRLDGPVEQAADLEATFENRTAEMQAIATQAVQRQAARAAAFAAANADSAVDGDVLFLDPASQRISDGLIGRIGPAAAGMSLLDQQAAGLDGVPLPLGLDGQG
jgi:predicted Zn finger-like uncharacterized protein